MRSVRTPNVKWIGTLAFGCTLVGGLFVTLMSEQPNQLALAATLPGAGGISISAFAWMLGAIEARLITLTAVMKARAGRS